MKIPNHKLKQLLKDAYWVCHPCGKKYGSNPNKNTVSTFHEGVCSICGETRAVTEIRDYGYTSEQQGNRTFKTGKEALAYLDKLIAEDEKK